MEQWRGLLVQAQAGDKEVRDKVIEENLGLVHHIVKRFAQRGYDLEELFQIGCIGLIKAVDHFDTDIDVRFSTYAVPLIMGEIRRFIRDNGALKVSRSAKENLWKISAAKVKINAEKGRDATIEEIMKETGLSKEEITLAIEADYEMESLSRVVFQKDGNEITLGERIKDEKDESENIVKKIYINQLMEGLSLQEKSLIQLRYFEDKTQTQTAGILGISQVQVSRMEKKILLKMRRE